MKIADQQKQLMRKALDLRRDIDMVYTLFANSSRAYADARCNELKQQYNQTMHELLAISKKTDNYFL